MTKVKFLPVYLLLASLSVSFSSLAQTAKLKGQITDKESQETLAGATITLVGTNYKTLSDMDGAFTFENLKPGVYKINVSYISYETTTVNKVEINNDGASNIKILLTPVESNPLKETESVYVSIKNQEMNI